MEIGCGKFGVKRYVVTKHILISQLGRESRDRPWTSNEENAE